MLGFSARRSVAFLPRNVVITAARRTPIGSFMGVLSKVSAVQLGSAAIKAALTQARLQPTQVEEVILGNVIQAGNKQSPARQVALAVGLPHATICTTINKVCASGMKTISLAAQSVALGHGNVIVAGGFESMSNAPFLIPNFRSGQLMGNATLLDSMMHDGLMCPFTNTPMGNLAEKTNEKYGITRQQQDEFAINSYKRAAEGWKRGFYRAEVEPFVIEDKRKGNTIIAEDEEYKKVKFDKIPGLKPAFIPTGSITAANASKINDGGCAIVVMSEEAARAAGSTPIARILSFADAETEPTHFEVAPSLAIEKALRYANLTKEQVDLFEINEAFSSAGLVNMKLLQLPIEKVNVNGGAVALGHPVGVSGARIVATLIYGLKEKGKRIGVAAICNGGGGATAIIVEAL